MKRWILAVGSALVLCFGLASCFDAKVLAGTVSKWPILPVPEELVLTAEELAAMTKFALENPKLALKLKQQSDAYKATILTYNKKAREHNKKVVEDFGKAMGWSKEDILEALKDGA